MIRPHTEALLVPPPPLIIWGAGGHACVVADIVRLVGAYAIVGFLDDEPGRCGEPFCRAAVLGSREQLDGLRAKGVKHLIVAVGSCPARLVMAEIAHSHGFRLTVAVHPQAIVADDAIIGAGTVIAAGAVVSPGALLGACVIVNTRASVDHECELDDGVHIGPGAHLGGRVTVGRGAWVGLGAAVRERVTVGAGALVGMGAVVVEDIPAGMVAYGVPARVVREVTPDDHS
jgi:UDP-N-acetylbacillosamine N-acetyltransferase